MSISWERRLAGVGLGAVEAGGKERLWQRVRATLEAMPGVRTPADFACFVPGRIEVLGKHTDYAGGRSLLCAAGRGFCMLASSRQDATIRLCDALSDETREVALHPDYRPPSAGWANYPGTVARRIARNFGAARIGADIAFASDLPPAAGMSSSSAFMVGVFLLLAAVNRLPASEAFRRELRTPEDLAAYLGAVENGSSFGSLAGDSGVGTFGGSEDHTAILSCSAYSLSLYSFCPTRREAVMPFPASHCFVIGTSGVGAEKAGGAMQAYNRLARAVDAIMRCWRADTGRRDPSLAAAASSSQDAPDRIRGAIRRSAGPEFPLRTLIDRFDQFFEESCVIIPRAVERISNGNIEGIGELADRSQELAERLLGNQIPETVSLARSARRSGAVAASAFGAGFGGSVWAIVATGDEAEFRREWSAAYRASHPGPWERATFFATRPSPPATMI